MIGGPTPGLVAVAHRGGNRLVDLAAARASGVDLVEADVHLVRGVLRVRHGGSAAIRQRHTLTVPNLEEILMATRHGPGLLLDLKGPSLSVAAEVSALLRERFPDLSVAVCTKQWRMFQAFAAQPLVQQVYTARTSWQLSRLRSRIQHAPVGAVSIRRQVLNPEVVAELREAGVSVLVWPVDSEEALGDARRLGATGVIGKNLTILRRVVSERSATSEDPLS